MAQLGRKENQVAKGDPDRQDCLAQLGSRDLQFLGHQGRRGLLDLRGSKAFLDQRGKQD